MRIVEDRCGTPNGSPSARVVAVAVEKIEDWVRRLGGGIIAGRSVHIEVPLIFGYRRLVEVMMYFAMRHVVQFPR